MCSYSFIITMHINVKHKWVYTHALSRYATIKDTAKSAQMYTYHAYAHMTTMFVHPL